MNDAIVIVAAMPGELKPLVRSWAALETVDGVDGCSIRTGRLWCLPAAWEQVLRCVRLGERGRCVSRCS